MVTPTTRGYVGSTVPLGGKGMTAPDRLAGYDQVCITLSHNIYRAGGSYTHHSVPKATPRREVRRGIPNRYISIDSVERSDDSASPDPDLKKLSRAMSHSLPNLDIDAGGSFTDAEGSTLEGTYVNGGDELCAVWGNIETLYSASFTGSIYCLTCASLLIQHLTCSKSTRMSFFVLRMPS